MPKHIQSLSEILPLYDKYIIDVWGVLHNGVSAFSHAIDALEKLQLNDKRFILLSNAPRRSASVVEKLDSVNFPRNKYDMVLSSGEATFLSLKSNATNHFVKWGKNIFHIGPKRDSNVFKDLGYNLSPIDQADIIINTGIEDFSETLEDYIPILNECLLSKAPMVCVNPDKYVMIEDKKVVCAGLLADYYIQHGGEVIFFGKPHRPIYDLARDMLTVKANEKVLCIGDSLHTDIQGAHNADFDSLWITQTGIHNDQLSDQDYVNTIHNYLNSSQHRPTYFSQKFSP